MAIHVVKNFFFIPSVYLLSKQVASQKKTLSSCWLQMQNDSLDYNVVDFVVYIQGCGIDFDIGT